MHHGRPAALLSPKISVIKRCTQLTEPERQTPACLQQGSARQQQRSARRRQPPRSPNRGALAGADSARVRPPPVAARRAVGRRARRELPLPLGLDGAEAVPQLVVVGGLARELRRRLRVLLREEAPILRGGRGLARCRF